MKYLNLASALLASLNPKSKSEQPSLSIDSYGQTTLSTEEEQAFMEWLFGSLMSAGYFGKAHLFWDSGQEGSGRFSRHCCDANQYSCTDWERDLLQQLRDMFGG